MKAVTAWNTEHYAPPGGGNVPYISRLAPGERSVSFEYADPLGSDGLRFVGAPLGRQLRDMRP